MMKPIEKIYSPLRYLAATAINIAVVYIAFMICRVVFYIYNKAYFPDMGWDDFRTIFKGGLVFDTSGIVYVNLIYILRQCSYLCHGERGKYGRKRPNGYSSY